MKKFFIISAAVLLLTAGCNKTVNNQAPQQNQNNQPSQNSQATSSPANQSDWNTYASPAKYGFSIQYPKDFGFNTSYDQIKPLSYIPVCDETTVGCIVYSGDKYKGTNFDGAGVSINILKDLNTESKCYNFKVATNEAQNQVADVTINGVIFKSATGTQGAAGHFDKSQIYRNFRNGMCYELAQRVASTDIGNYPEGTIKEFNENEVWNNLKQILSTFKFVDNSMSNWKNYKNVKYGYQLNYPSDWKVEESNEYNSEIFDSQISCVSFYSPDKKYVLEFGLKNKGEKIRLCPRTGIGAGEPTLIGFLQIGNLKVKPGYLIYEGKAKEIFFTNTEKNGYGPDEIAYNKDKQIIAEFTYLGNQNYEQLELRNIPETQEAIEILSTFSLNK
jgi:hypothetical protein